MGGIFGGPARCPKPKLYLCLPTRLQKRNWRCTVARLTTRTLLYPLNTCDKVGSFAFQLMHRY